ncbi:hydrogenase 3 maturation endopeptidase HyCI [Candidatus Bipolaricaulota bacterium]|nr:hydrogenase 3 maturation endopeptidase HyCI [Candidatus Bipolaricaulota bacterium]
MTRMLLAIGNPLAGDDGVAARTAAYLRDSGADWRIVDAGLSPENVTGLIRRETPDLLVVVDAARMGAPIGSVFRLPTEFADRMLLSTHGLPLPFLIERLREAAGRIVLIGIEPKSTALGEAISEEAVCAAQRLAELLAADAVDRVPRIENMDPAMHS